MKLWENIKWYLGWDRVRKSKNKSLDYELVGISIGENIKVLDILSKDKKIVSNKKALNTIKAERKKLKK